MVLFLNCTLEQRGEKMKELAEWINENKLDNVLARNPAILVKLKNAIEVHNNI